MKIFDQGNLELYGMCMYGFHHVSTIWMAQCNINFDSKCTSLNMVHTYIRHTHTYDTHIHTNSNSGRICKVVPTSNKLPSQLVPLMTSYNSGNAPAYINTSE